MCYQSGIMAQIAKLLGTMRTCLLSLQRTYGEEDTPQRIRSCHPAEEGYSNDTPMTEDASGKDVYCLL